MILSLQTTEPASVSESVRPIRMVFPILRTWPSSTYRTRSASPTLTGSGSNPPARSWRFGRRQKASETAQFNDQFLGQSFREEALVLVAARDSKRHDRHRRRPLPRVARKSGRRGLKPVRADFSANLIDADWLGQVLKTALAEIVENESASCGGYGRIALRSPKRPGAAACWMRAARLTPSPRRSSPCTATSARWRPKRIFSGSTSDPSMPASATPISTAHLSALIGLGNSASVASPALLNILPSSEATFSDIRAWQVARRATVFSSDFSIIAE